jgi:hypothetical protein
LRFKHCDDDDDDNNNDNNNEDDNGCNCDETYVVR